jgi:selenocysteine lyase/cysteine desulfurase
LMGRLTSTTGVEVLAADQRARLGVISFIVEGMHYDSVVRLLSDRFGIQARGGCSCAGTYGHHLLRIDRVRSEAIREALLRGEMESKPGWVRLSLHPTMTDDEIDYIADAVEEVAALDPGERFAALDPGDLEWVKSDAPVVHGRPPVTCPVPRI